MNDNNDVERRLDFILREMDEFIVLANNPRTERSVKDELIMVSQIQTRAALILDYFTAADRTRRKARDLFLEMNLENVVNLEGILNVRSRPQ